MIDTALRYSKFFQKDEKTEKTRRDLMKPYGLMKVMIGALLDLVHVNLLVW